MLGLAVALGAAAVLIPQLNQDAFPDVTNVQVQINTEAQGLAAEEVEQLITYPIEAVMYALPDVEEVRSISKTGLSVITVVFKKGTINIRVTLAPSASLDTALAVAAQLEARLMTFPEVTYASSRVGRPELGGDPEPVSNIEVYVGLKPVGEWTSANDRFELRNRFEEVLSVHLGLLFSFSQPIAARVDELLSGVKAQPDHRPQCRVCSTEHS